MSRGSAWSDNEVAALVAIWKMKTSRNSLMVQPGTRPSLKPFPRSSRKVATTGIGSNLKAEYKKIKDHNGVTGNGRKSFKFYKKSDEILGHQPALAPTFLVDIGSPSHGTATAQSQESDTEGGTDGKGYTIT